ncbi:MAG: FHA domain-containing protein [Planctomycetota bacterium]|nr:FHA domain-containing protein [Planctomycetota bacterium]
MLAQLIPLDGEPPVTLKRDITLVGRKRELSDLTIDKPSISKLHCLVVKTDGLLFVRDLGSTNGTKVNGQRVTRGALLPGDELAFASIKFRVHLGPDPDVEDDGEADSYEKTEYMSRGGHASDSDGSDAEYGDSADADVRLLSDEYDG